MSLTDIQLTHLADEYEWTVASIRDHTAVFHPAVGRMDIYWKTSRRRQAVVNRVEFYTTNGCPGDNHWKASLSARSGNVREAIEHFMAGHGVATRKAG